MTTDPGSVSSRPGSALIVVGSPRKNGNTRALAEWIGQGMSQAGNVNVQIVDAAHLRTKVNGCGSCYACQRSEEFGCRIDDELSGIIRQMLVADVIVLATPLYWFGMSAQTKAVVDRMFSLSKNYRPHEHVRNARIALAVSAEGSEDNSGYQPLADQFSRVSRYLTGAAGPTLFAFNCPFDQAEFRNFSEQSGLRVRAIEFGKSLIA